MDALYSLIFSLLLIGLDAFPEIDYPPTANAKSEVVIYLPQNEVTLNGNLSTDDKGIKSWEWIKSPDTDKEVDMKGTNGPYLHLSKLEVGAYKFILKVTDTVDQTSTTEVHLFVKPESNMPPVANAGIDQEVTLPLQVPVLLNDSRSKDDIKIAPLKWEQFRWNDSIGAWDITFANVATFKQSDYPPTANAKSEVVIYLPQNEVTLNGNLSSDDTGIKSWEWIKSPDTEKAVDMKGTNGPYLHLSQLEVGVYKFILKVTDTADQTSTKEVQLLVKSENNIPPVANAGLNQKVTLPVQGPFMYEEFKYVY